MTKERYIHSYRLEKKCKRLLRVKNQPLEVKDLFDLSRDVVALVNTYRPKNKEKLAARLSRRLTVSNRKDGVFQFVDINFRRAQPSQPGKSHWETYGLRPDGDKFIAIYWPEKTEELSEGHRIDLSADQVLAFAQTIWQAYEKVY